jgi:hypothetical protein
VTRPQMQQQSLRLVDPERPERVVVRSPTGLVAVVVVAREKPWAVIQVWWAPLGCWLVCGDADMRFRLDQHARHPQTRGVLDDLLRRCGSVLDRLLVLEAIDRAKAEWTRQPT